MLLNQFLPKHKDRILAHGGILLLCLKIIFSGVALYVSDFAFAGGITTSELLNCTNNYRKQANLAPLVLNTNLSRASLLKLEDMDVYDYWAHTNPNNGTEPWSFFQAEHYEYKTAGENLAFDYNTSDGICRGWMNSPSHRENILDPTFREVGFGIRRVNLGHHGEGNLVVQFFGTPLTGQIGGAAEKEDQSRSPTCKSEIFNTFKILSPACGFINESMVKLEAEILDDSLRNISFKINDSDVEGRVMDSGNNRIVRAEKALPDGDYMISASPTQSALEAVVNVTVDTTPPVVDETKVNVKSRLEQKSFIFDIEVPIIEEHLEAAEIYYQDSIGETITKNFQLLGEDIYHARVSFPADYYVPSYNATITTLDKAGNSLHLTIDLFPPRPDGLKGWLVFINFQVIWKYLVLSFLVFIAVLYLLDMSVFRREKTENDKEVEHHSYAQLAIIAVLFISILSFF